MICNVVCDRNPFEAKIEAERLGGGSFGKQLKKYIITTNPRAFVMSKSNKMNIVGYCEATPALVHRFSSLENWKKRIEFRLGISFLFGPKSEDPNPGRSLFLDYES